MNFVGDDDHTEYFTAWNKIGPIIFKEQENVSKRKEQGIKGNNDGAENNEIMIPFWLLVLLGVILPCGSVFLLVWTFRILQRNGRQEVLVLNRLLNAALTSDGV